jgi:hypothetical protein
MALSLSRRQLLTGDIYFLCFSYLTVVLFSLHFFALVTVYVVCTVIGDSRNRLYATEGLSL